MNLFRKPKSRQFLIKQQQKNAFIGREAQIESFRINLKQRPDEWCFLFNICGQRGVGKSTLIKQLRKVSDGANFLTTYTNHSEVDALAVMERCAAIFEKQEKKMHRFNERYKVYLQKKEEIESDPEAPKGLAGFLGKSMAKAGFGLAKQVPGSGVVTPFVDEEAIATQVGEWTSFVAKKIQNKDEVRLVNEPIKVLTPLFLQDINEIAENSNIVLFFDNYETTSDFLDAWFRDILLHPDELYGTFPFNLILVFAGTKELSKSCWGDYREIISQLNLEPFTENEVEEYLVHQGITDPQVIDEIFQISKGLPLFVDTLAAENHNDFVLGRRSNSTLIEYFLSGINDKKRQKLVLEASLSLLLNRDIIAVLNSEDSADELFNWLKSMPFVEERSEGGWSYHEIVRTQMLHKQRLLSPNRWIEIHGKLASYYETLCSSFLFNSRQKWHNSSWQNCFLNGLYHLLCCNPNQGLTKALSTFLNALERQFSSEFARRCAEIVATAGRASAISEIQFLGDQLLDGLRAFNENRYENGIEMFTLLITQYNLDEESKAIALSWRGEAYRLIGLYEKSLQDFDEAISINTNDSWILVSRSSTYRKMRRYHDSLQDCDRAIELDIKDIRAFTSRGETYLRMRKYEEALKDFDHAIELEPDDAWSISSRGKAYQQIRQYEEALKDFDLAIKLNPSDVWTLSNRGFIYRKQGYYQRALEDYNRAIELEPNNARSFASRGETYRLMRQYDKALEDFNSAVGLKLNDGWALCRRAETYLLLREYENSLADFEIVVALSPNNDWRLFTYSLAFRAYGNLEKASAKVCQAIQIAKSRYEKNLDDYRTALTLSLYYLSNDDVNEAELLYESVLSKNVRLELIQEAMQGLDEFLEIFPNHFFGKNIKKRLLGLLET